MNRIYFAMAILGDFPANEMIKISDSFISDVTDESFPQIGDEKTVLVVLD